LLSKFLLPNERGRLFGKLISNRSFLLFASSSRSLMPFLSNGPFSKVERDVIARGIFTSVKDLARKLRRYINAYSANAKPIQWRYSDPTRRIRSNVVSATGH
jgi:hypothetical protein